MTKSELKELISYIESYSQKLDRRVDEHVIEATVLDALVKHYKKNKDLSAFGTVENALLNVPIEEMPLYVEHPVIVFRLISKWRLERGI